jgi:transposase-like protein
VEVDESYWGASESTARGRELEKKALIVIAAEEDGKGIGRIRMRRIDRASAENLGRFVADCVVPGGVVHTDGWDGYAGLEELGYTHRATALAKSRKNASELLPRVHRVVALLKNWLRGTHQGAVSHEHLDYYLDEFTFRFNRRTSRYRGKLFYRLLQQALAVQPVPYKEMVKHVHAPGRKRRRRHKG